MKKVIGILGFLIATAFSSIAQIDANAIGLRFGGGGFGTSAEISYQRNMGGNNRIELDLGGYSRASHGGFGVAGMYHWGWNLVEDLHWYMGPGVGIAFFNNRTANETYMSISAGGQIGLEYDFRNLGIPLQASLDFRPMFTVLGSKYGHAWSSALAIRYLF